MSEPDADSLDQSQASKGAPAGVYATHETATYLKSIGVDPASNPGLNGKSILFVQKGDVTPGTAGTKEHAANYTEAAVTGSPLGPNLTRRSAEFLTETIPTFVREISPDLKTWGRDPEHPIADAALSALPGNHPQANPSPQGMVCIVSLPSKDYTPASIFADALGLDPKVVTDVPGSTEDWHNLIVNHELGHCEVPTASLSNIDELRGEVSADRISLKKYPASRDQSVKDAYRDFRALDGFGGFVTNDKDTPVFANALTLQRDLSLVSSEDKVGLANAINNAINGHATLPYLDGADIDPGTRPEFYAMLNVNEHINTVLGANSVTDLMAGKSLNDAAALSIVGAQKGSENAVLNFATLKALYDGGSFTQGTAEADYARNIIRIQNQYMSGMDSLPEYQETYQKVQKMMSDPDAQKPGVDWTSEMRQKAPKVSDTFFWASSGNQSDQPQIPATTRPIVAPIKPSQSS
jgi:hypothetical protein